MMQDEMWSSMPERGRWLPLRAAYLLIRALGGRLTAIIVWGAAIYYTLVHGTARRASREYFNRLSTYFGPDVVRGASPSLIANIRHFAAFGACIIDKVRAWAGDFGVKDFDFEGREEFRARVLRGRGAIILSGHLGNVEVARAVIDAMAEVKINALMFTKNSAAFSRLLKEVNPRSFVRIFPIEELGVDTILELEQRVEAGECIALMADRLSAGARDRLVPADFLGGRAHFPEGPFLLASVLGCPVYTFWCTRQPGGRYLVRMTKFAERVEIPRSRRRQALEEWVQRYASELENECRKAPFQWFNFFPYWEQGPARSSEKSDPVISTPGSGPAVDNA